MMVRKAVIFTSFQLWLFRAYSVTLEMLKSGHSSTCLANAYGTISLMVHQHYSPFATFSEKI